MAATVMIVAIVAVLAILGLKKMVMSAKGQGCCSSTAGGEIKPRKKKLEGEIVEKKIVDIEGMSCINCQYKVERKINDIKGAAAQVNYKKNQAVVSMDRVIEDDIIKNAVESMGYIVTSIHAV